MSDDDLDAPAAFHAYLSGPLRTEHSDPTKGTLRELTLLALRLAEKDPISARIKLDEGGSIGWTQIATIAEQNGIA